MSMDELFVQSDSRPTFLMGNSLNFSVTFECSTKVNNIVNIQCFIANQRDARESSEFTMKVLRVLPYGFCGCTLDFF